jgi:hypothetical protein
MFDGMETRRLRLIVALVTVALLAFACAPPVAYRRSAVVPMPEGPVRSGRPLDHGEVRFTGYAAQSLATPDGAAIAPFYEDPGVLIPQTVLGGSIYAGVHESVEVGLGAAVGTQGSLAANFPHDVIPFASGPSVRISPGVRGNFRVSDKFTFSVITELGVAMVPQALFECVNMDRLDDPPNTPHDPAEPVTGWCTTNEEFDLVEQQNLNRFVGAIMLEPVATLSDVWAVLGHVGVTQGLANIGFEPLAERAHESTLRSYATVVVGVGGEARSGPIAVGLNADVLIPLENTIAAMPVISLRFSPRIPGAEERRQATEPAP